MPALPDAGHSRTIDRLRPPPMYCASVPASFAGGSPAERLVVSCARPNPDEGAAARIANLVQAGGIDWEKLSAIASAHGVQPLLCQNLRRAAPKVMPLPVLHKLERECIASGARNLSLCAELIRVMDLLATNRIRAIPFKGPVLAASLYRSVCLRDFADLDLLIDAADAPRAVALLCASGCGRKNGLPSAAPSHVSLTSPREGWTIEIQWHLEKRWELQRPRSGPAFDFEHFWRRCKIAVVCGNPMPSLAVEDLLLLLSVHAARHSWSRLIWLCDIAELVRLSGDMDWEWVLRTAARVRCLRRVYAGLYFAAAVLDVRLPESVIGCMRRDPAAASLAGQVKRRLFSRTPGPGSAGGKRSPVRECADDLRRHALFISAHERRRDRFRLWLRFLWTRLKPSEADWKPASLPRVLAPAVCLLRPVRLMKVYGTASMRSVLARALPRWTDRRLRGAVR